MMHTWVVEAEAILDGSWAQHPEEITNQAIGQLFDAYLNRLFQFLNGEEIIEDEKVRLGELFRVLKHLRPGLIQCYDIEGFPRTNNDMERTIRAIKMQYRRISGRKNWNAYLLCYGRCVVYQEWWLHQPDGEIQLHARLRRVSTSSWHHARQSHLEQLHRFRFRHHPLEYLASLEERWEQTIGT